MLVDKEHHFYKQVEDHAGVEVTRSITKLLLTVGFGGAIKSVYEHVLAD